MRACLLLMLCPALAAASPAPTTDECVVWQRELSFARALSDHDAVAFAAHLHPHAAFAVSQPTPIRGREAIARVSRRSAGRSVGLATFFFELVDGQFRPLRSPGQRQGWWARQATGLRHALTSA